jgi:methyl-accepting chemotaxis protein
MTTDNLEPAAIESEAPPARPRRGLTIRARLYLAFGSVAAMTAVASAVAFVSYSHVGATLAQITGEGIPAIKISLRLAKESAEIAAAAPALLTANTSAEMIFAQRELQTKQTELGALVDAVADAQRGAGGVDQLRQEAARMKAHLEKLGGLVERRLAARDERELIVAKMLAAHRSLAEKLAPLVDDAGFSLQLGLQTATEKNDIADATKKLGALVDNEVNLLSQLTSLRADSNLVAGVLAEAATTPRKDLMPPMRDRFAAAAAHIKSALDALKETTDEGKVLTPLAVALMGFGRGDGNIFELRQRELDATTEAGKVVEENRNVAAELGRAVQLLVDDADAASKEAAETSAGAIEQGRTLLLAIAGLTLAIAALIAWLYVGRSVARRLRRLSDSMLAIADGDFAAAIPEGGSDEISHMAKALAIFRDNGQATRLAEERAVVEREEMAATRRHELHALAGRFEESVKHVVETVAGAATEMQSTAEQMVGAAKETLDQAGAASTSSAQAAESAQMVAGAAGELSATTSEIGRQVAQSAEIASRAVDEAKQTNATVQGLAEAAQKIGEVVQLISAIAGQTNLLALNATIEAARAGDAGKGFAVVASEVKTLATQTAKATEEIATQVGRIQGATKDAVAAIQSIGTTIASMNEISTSIAAAIEEQGATTNEIVRSVEQAAESTGSVSKNIGGVTRAADETGQAASQVLSAAADLAKQSVTLEQEVDRFLEQVRAA